jgi:hypothetical protein
LLEEVSTLYSSMKETAEGCHQKIRASNQK